MLCPVLEVYVIFPCLLLPLFFFLFNLAIIVGDYSSKSWRKLQSYIFSLSIGKFVEYDLSMTHEK